ncbi:hypothetical protein ACFQE0_04215 [Methylobacterium komagatae]|uniref:Uncharacterized protein n=1 Tax=Methylobacterium komagatae TaxID=374425 RepID=A0ABW2BG79_9HYPH
MRRDRATGNGILEKAERGRERPCPLSRPMPEAMVPGTGSDAAKKARSHGTEPLSEEERRALEAGWSFLE